MQEKKSFSKKESNHHEHYSFNDKGYFCIFLGRMKTFSTPIKTFSTESVLQYKKGPFSHWKEDIYFYLPNV